MLYIFLVQLLYIIHKLNTQLRDYQNSEYKNYNKLFLCYQIE